MKKIHLRLSLLLLPAALLLLAGCDHTVSVESTVYEDGSIDRTIVLYEADSSNITNNFIGVNEAKGWTTTVEKEQKSKQENSKDKKINITFRKHFPSAAEANAKMPAHIDTVFQIVSDFQKKNRWFYSYIEYSDTYRALNRFKALPPENFFTQEDYAFISRLPAEGKPITKADSLYLARLNEKIFDIYGTRTIFEELFRGMLSVLHQYNVPSQWSDSLKRKKEEIYQHFVKDEIMEKNGLISIGDYLNIPLPGAARIEMGKHFEEMESRLNFISEAYTAKFRHAIRMPWTVVATNADSASGNRLFWNPPVIKFMLTDYTMTARARKMNAWAVVLSGIIILTTAGLFLFRRKRAGQHPSD